jgi:repressor LexA
MARTNDLTARQQEIYDFIRNKVETRGFPPSIREICAAFQFKSPNAVTGHLRALEKKKAISRMEHKSARAIELPNIRVGRVSFPLLGDVAAGPALEAVQNSPEKVDLGEIFAGTDQFCLKVRGTSMIEDHIQDGDIVIIKKKPVADNGERVVAMIDNQVTLKRFYQQKDGIRLEPSNALLKPIIINNEDGKEVSILGVLVGVVRRC